MHKVTTDLKISVPSLTDYSTTKLLPDFSFDSDGDGYGIAIDIGTTTVAVYLANLANGTIINQLSFLNPQISFGGDVMSRLAEARTPKNLAELTRSVHDKTRRSIRTLTDRSGVDLNSIRRYTVSGNAAMTHFWLGRAGEGLELFPFHSFLEKENKIEFPPDIIGLPDECACSVCPVIAGFIGGDVLCGILSLDQDLYDRNFVFIDLGTNGEIVVGAGGKLCAASTAAGPAFEGVGLFSGMPASNGAVCALSGDGQPEVIGGSEPVGICGSGYISTFAYLLKTDQLAPSGLLDKDGSGERKWAFKPGTPPFITQDDVRKFQLAKGAIACGIEILLKIAGLEPAEIDRVILTGSFGTGIDPKAAIDVGLLPGIDYEKVSFIPNATGRGALLNLAHQRHRERSVEIKKRAETLNLADHPDFEESFVRNLSFPDWGG